MRSTLTVLGRCTLLAFTVLVSTATSAESGGKQTNVVLIVSDYMGYRDTEPYGATDVRTPGLNRLASEGVRMTDFYAAAPVCGPARAALYTGQYPARLNFESNIRSEADGLSSSVPTLSRWLKQAGYRTALFGKWHLGYASDFTPNAHGYDEFLGHHEWTIGYYHHETMNGEPGLWENDHLVERDGYLTDLLTEGAVKFIEENREHPFFVTLAYNAALPPYQPPDLGQEKWGEGWDVNKASRDDYVRMVERMDWGIGEVLGALDDNHLSDNTLVVYTYDHGGRHLVNSAPLFHGFATLWEGGIRTPLIMRLPEVLPAHVNSSLPGIAMDITATILDAVGLADEAESLDGISLIPLLRDDQIPASRQLFWQANLNNFGRQRAIRDGRWKFIEHGGTQFLFDLDSGPDERNNLFYEHPDVVNRLRAALIGWQEGFADQ